ncbi:mammaglobin-A [Hippopotamus amphibius kiboko]|uniref:mammaglobin-A n=1 Tax=Hippopotamus amphibius kiboko TaxID=575201 RepID=UPI002591F50B|nr:mammaglobin-A [Hippopotamus amphibius kiboko]
MKLVTVLMLLALPLYCYAGSGCSLLKEVVSKTVNTSVSKIEFRAFLAKFIDDKYTADAVDEFKECFLKQSAETLNNFNEMMEIIYNSIYCVLF